MHPALDFLDLSSKREAEEWTPCQIVLLGAERYPLYSEDNYAKIKMVEGGFKTKIKTPFKVEAEQLLGLSYGVAVVCDVEIRMPSLTLSAAKLYPNLYPRVLKRGQSIDIRHPSR